MSSAQLQAWRRGPTSGGGGVEETSHQVPPPLPGRRGTGASRAPIPSMRVNNGKPLAPPPPPRTTTTTTNKVLDDAVSNAEMEKLIPLVNKLQDALSLTESKDEISLPQIAVVGGQSSGKSSVLENIVGKSFLPRGSGIVTRRPLVLQLVNGPGPEFGEFLHSSGQRYYDFDEIRREIDADTARVCGTNKGLSPHAIHLKVQSPNVLNLTLIDLPGATKVAVGDQPEDIPKQITDMILSYIAKPSCIVLAVSPANADLANSDALQLAKMVDPSGDRTLGVLTKLDLMDRGTDARAVFTGESTDLPRLKLGYVGVVNRSQADIHENKTIAQARAAEDEFFKTSYPDVAHRLGTAFLVRECAKLLAASIKSSVPTLEREIAASLAARKKQLLDLGDQTPDAKKRKLTECLLVFCERYQALVSGAPLPASDDLAAGHRVSELSGGARVERVFREVLTPEVRTLKVLDDLAPDEVRTLVQNVHGLGGGLFTPDQAFIQLVRRNVRRLAKPATKCVELVHAELAALVQDAADFPALHAYPDLQSAVLDLVSNVLRDNLDSAARLLTSLVDMEVCRVNIAHPDFVGAQGITTLMANVEARLKKQHSPTSAASAAAAQHNPTDYGSDPTHASSGAPQQPTKHGKFGFKSSKTPPPPPPLPAAKKVMTAEETAAFRERMIAEAGPPQPPAGSGTAAAAAAADDDDDDSGLRAARFSHFSHGLTLKERVEVHTICELCASYFSIVKKTFADIVPKAVTLNLVDATTANLTSQVLANLNTDDSVETLMAASPAIAQLADNLKTSIAALEQASAAIREMRYHI